MRRFAQAEDINVNVEMSVLNGSGRNEDSNGDDVSATGNRGGAYGGITRRRISASRDGNNSGIGGGDGGNGGVGNRSVRRTSRVADATETETETGPLAFGSRLVNKRTSIYDGDLDVFAVPSKALPVAVSADQADRPEARAVAIYFGCTVLIQFLAALACGMTCDSVTFKRAFAMFTPFCLAAASVSSVCSTVRYAVPTMRSQLDLFVSISLAMFLIVFIVKSALFSTAARALSTSIAGYIDSTGVHDIQTKQALWTWLSRFATDMETSQIPANNVVTGFESLISPPLLILMQHRVNPTPRQMQGGVFDAILGGERYLAYTKENMQTEPWSLEANPYFNRTFELWDGKYLNQNQQQHLLYPKEGKYGVYPPQSYAFPFALQPLVMMNPSKWIDSATLLRGLQAGQYIDRSSRALSVDCVFVNRDAESWVYLSFLFEFPLGGGVFVNHPAIVAGSWLYPNHRVGEDVVVINEIAPICFLLMFWLQMVQTKIFVLVARWREYRKISMLITMFDAMEVVPLVFILIVFAFQVESQLSIPCPCPNAATNGIIPLYAMFWQNSSVALETRNVFLALIQICIVISIVQYAQWYTPFQLLPRMLALAARDLISFFFVAGIVFTAFALGFFIIFNGASEFATLPISFFSLFLALVGGLDAMQFTASAGILGPTVYSFFIIVMVFTVLTVVIGILSEAFVGAKTEVSAELSRIAELASERPSPPLMSRAWGLLQDSSIGLKIRSRYPQLVNDLEAGGNVGGGSGGNKLNDSNTRGGVSGGGNGDDGVGVGNSGGGGGSLSMIGEKEDEEDEDEPMEATATPSISESMTQQLTRDTTSGGFDGL